MAECEANICNPFLGDMVVPPRVLVGSPPLGTRQPRRRCFGLKLVLLGLFVGLAVLFYFYVFFSVVQEAAE